MKVYMWVEETSICGVFSSKEKLMETYFKLNSEPDETLQDIKELFDNPSSGYPAIEELTVDKYFSMDR
jgi:hypothetical protein